MLIIAGYFALTNIFHICRYHPLVLIYVCTRMGQRLPRSSSRHFQTILNLYFCPEAKIGAEEVSIINHISHIYVCWGRYTSI